MSINYKLNEIAEYVHKLPELDFNNVSFNDDCVDDILNKIFHKTLFKMSNDYKKNLKRNIVRALNNENSSLRKILNEMSVNTSDINNESNKCNETLKQIISCNYTSSDFENYNAEVLNNVCKKLKVSINRKNRLPVYRKCKKVLNNDSLHNTSNIEINKCMTVEPIPTLEEINSNLVDSNSVFVVDGRPEILKLIDFSNYPQDKSGGPEDTGLKLNAACEPISTEISLDMSAMTFKNIVTSTPERKQGVVSVRNIKTSIEKYKRCESPLKNAFF